MIVQDNACDWGGGAGVYCHGSSPTIEGVIIRDNASQDVGGGLYCKGNSAPTLRNVLINGNTAAINQFGGGGIACWNSSPVLYNVTISGNSSSIGGGLSIIHLLGYGEQFVGSNPVLVNTILWGNSPDEVNNSAPADSGSITISYSDVQGGLDSIGLPNGGAITWGDGNIDVDPMFVDTNNGDYTLQMDSPLIDAGHPDSTDADGTRADMGAYYYDQFGQPTRVLDLISTPSASTIGLAWSANSASSSYNIYRSTDAETDFYTAVPFITTSDTALSDSSVSADNTYYYRIGAVDSDGNEGLLAFKEHG
ncbi:uncharacterized protein METZ01_LOCUS356509, partial [marine metagenome]